jgi:hypothetical protein
LSELLERIKSLVKVEEVRISEHGYDELSEDGIFVRDAIRGVSESVAVEEYPPSGRGPAVLVLEFDRGKEPIHVVWGIPAGHESPAVLITAYRPNPEIWDSDFMKRRK